jgi:spermidine synthase
VTGRSLASRLVFVLFFLSGATGLVYQVVWLRQLTLVFGATAYASSAVLSTFMGGLALGSHWAGRRAGGWRVSPLKAYGLLELCIAAYAAAIPWLLASLTPVLGSAWQLGADRHFLLFGLIKFASIAVLILPATTLMGATLPVLSRVAIENKRSLGGGVGALYAVNTFGAVVGTIAAAFVALPMFGMRRTLLVNVALNAVVGITAWALGRRAAEPAARAESTSSSPITASVPSRTLVLTFAASGCAAMVLEVAWTRGLALVLGSSVYAYASMLTAFLVGLASGAATAARFLERRPAAVPRTLLSIALGAAGVLSFFTALGIQALPRLFAEIYFRLSPPPAGWWLAQLGLSLLIMFPTTFALGWVFPLVLEAAGGERGAIAASVGRVYAANTLGTIFGAAAAGFFLIPLLGVGTTLVSVAVFQLLLGATLTLGAAGRRRVIAVSCMAGALLAILLRPRWDVLLMNSGVYMNVQDVDHEQGWPAFLEHVRENNELVFARDGLTASVLVARQPMTNSIYLAVNGKVDASSRADLETQILAGHIPLLLHPAPKDVLVVGLASGISVGSAASHPVSRIRVVEVEAAMIEAARLFGPYNGSVLDDPRVSISINDARNALQFDSTDYDVIISEPSNPWMTVASNLFTEDFFRIATTRLRPGGVFGQWIQTYCLAPEQLRSILAAFHRAFPHVLVFETLNGVDLLLVGSNQPMVLDTDRVDLAMRELRVRLDLGRVGISEATDLASQLQTGGGALDELLKGARVNTDDNGIVEFSAPKDLYLDSQDENLAMLQGDAEDPLAPVAALVRTSDSPDSFRLAMIRRWIQRGQASRARRAIPFFSDPIKKSEAESWFTSAGGRL